MTLSWPSGGDIAGTSPERIVTKTQNSLLICLILTSGRRQFKQKIIWGQTHFNCHLEYDFKRITLWSSLHNLEQNAQSYFEIGVLSLNRDAGIGFIPVNQLTSSAQRRSMRWKISSQHHRFVVTNGDNHPTTTEILAMEIGVKSQINLTNWEPGFQKNGDLLNSFFGEIGK